MTYFAGPPPESEPGIGALTTGRFLAHAADAHAGREAIAFHEPIEGGTISWTYRELEAAARRIARGLLGAGMVKGTRVALLMGNGPRWVASSFGVTMAGGVLVPMNTYFEPPEVEYVLRHCDASILMLQEELAGHNYLDAVRQLCPVLPSPQLPFLRYVACLGTDSWDRMLEDGDAVPESDLDACMEQVSPHDEALVIYTSGTTAKPKGVMHTHRAPTLQSWRFAQQLRLDSEVRTWSAFPFFWTAGFCMVMGATLAAGGCLVLQDRFDPRAALRLLASEKVTMPHAWPHQLAAMEDHPDWLATDLSSLRQVEPSGSFGRHPSVHVPEGAWSPRAAYGLTETFTIVSSYPADTPMEDRAGSQGVILPGTIVRITDPDTREHQPVGASGEIAVKGTTLMRGYLKVAPEECFDADGYFHTGDAGYVDEENRLFWTGRISDLIKTGGANVSPVELEETLLLHPELKVAMAVGIPHPTLGETVVVCAVAHEGSRIDQAGVREFLRGRVASYKIPQRVLFFTDDELSLTGNAKIRADKLRELAAIKLKELDV